MAELLKRYNGVEVACPQRAQCLAPGRSARPQCAHLVTVCVAPTGRPHCAQKTASLGSVRPQWGQASRASWIDRAGGRAERVGRRVNRQPATPDRITAKPIAIKPSQPFPSEAGGGTGGRGREPAGVTMTMRGGVGVLRIDGGAVGDG